MRSEFTEEEYHKAVIDTAEIIYAIAVQQDVRVCLGALLNCVLSAYINSNLTKEELIRHVNMGWDCLDKDKNDEK